MTFRIIEADCVEAMRDMDEASVDAIVCDPPYGLEFMGKEWDRLSHVEQYAKPGENNAGFFNHSGHGRLGMEWKPEHRHAMQEWHQAWATEALRVLKPGGHLLAFGGTRTYHRLACAIEDAGFEIRDSLIWLYGSGFPKSLDVSKAIDKAAGAERETVGRKPVGWGGLHANDRLNDDGWEKIGAEYPDGQPITAPATPEAEKWNGWGTALKPAHEPVVLARKPLIGTVSRNVQEHGTGALNVDGCRVGTEVETWPASRSFAPGISSGYTDGIKKGPTQETGDAPAGRWPANVVLDPEAAEELDRQSGAVHGAGYARDADEGTHGGEYGLVGFTHGSPAMRYGDTGGASRFFYTAKASRAERNAGLDGFEEREARDTYGDGLQGPRPHTREDYEWQRKGARNSHPTVKPIALMRWLCRLVTPPGGTILDPFTGSGTTGCAAVLEDFRFIGIEREAEYAEIARARIEYWNRQPKQLELAA